MPSSSTCLIVVHISTAGAPASAARVVLAGIGPADVKIAGDDAMLRSLLLADWNGHRTVVDRVDLSGTGADLVRLVSLSPVLPVAFDPLGTRFLYLVGHNPPALWIAGIGSGHLVGAEDLLPDAQLEAAAW